MSTTNSEFRLGSSRTYAMLSVGVHVGALACLAMAFVPPPALALTGLLLALNLWIDLRLTAWRTAPGAVVAIGIEKDCWSFVRRNASSTTLSRVPDARVVWGAVVIKTGSETGSGLRVVVAADALPPDEFRRLRACALAAGSGL
jgi:hypothetical protein